jgi:hypothetical protein
MLILASVYLLTVSYMAIAFNSHLALRRSYAAIDPYSSTPALNTPSRRKDHSNSADAMADQGDNSGDKIVAAIRRWFNSASSVFKKQSPSASNSSSDNSGRNKNGSAASANEQQYLIENYLAAEADYITSLNTLVLFCIFCASSAGLRLAYYLLYASGAFLTVLSATIYTASVMGIDGRQIGMILSVMTAVIAGIWIARPLESERRRWYNLKVNYNL